MRVLVVGRGGREHAIVKKLYRDGVAEIFAAPGNAGMTEATLVPISDDDIDGLVEFAVNHAIDLAIIGPESALMAGLVDDLTSRGIPAFGPEKAGALLEGSKAFAKELMAKYGIPTANYAEFSELPAALDYLNTQRLPIVIKADGLAAGKGVIIAASLAEAEQAVTGMLSGGKFGDAGKKIVIEEFLDGEEFSLMSFVCGEKYLPMPIARDYKRAFDGDAGPNTGGMGAHSPNPLITDADRQEALSNIVEPTLAALAAEGIPFAGVLYAGLMKTTDGIKVIEFNVRFGDPETEVVLPLLETPLTELILSLSDKSSDDDRGANDAQNNARASWSEDATVGVVLASRGYPGDYPKGAPIAGLAKLTGTPNIDVYHMGTASNDGQIVTNGGRVLFVVGRAASLSEARELAYDAVSEIDCKELFHRSDIAAQY